MATEAETVRKLEAAPERYRPLKGFWHWLVIAFGLIVSFLGVNLVFDWRFFVNYMLYDYVLYYLVLALLLSICFLSLPAKSGLAGRWVRIAFWGDILLFLLSLGFGLYLSYHGLDVIQQAWQIVAPTTGLIAATILTFSLIEGVRRTSGNILGIFILIAALYPLVAEHMPGILEGIGRPFDETMLFHMLSKDSAMGTLVHVYTRIVLGYVIFGIAIIGTGGGKFFLDLALSLVGATRGGTAKVAVFASALFGMVNGQPIVNVMTTGPVTIPAMKKAGFAPHFAGAVEACASTAGTFTPPIMGLSAFVMASFINREYADVALAAAIPAFLYYLVLYVQIDGYAVKHRLMGLSKAEQPSFIATLKYGWFYLPVLLTLIYVLFVLRLEGKAPYIATALMLALAQLRKDTRFTRQSLVRFLENNARTVMELFVIMAAVGMLLGSFSMTGLAAVFAREMLVLAGGNLPLLLILAMIASLIMGMGMTLIACYIFLALIIAPALVMAGINIMAAHLFILYAGMLSYITPPVALCAAPASAISGAPYMKVAMTAVRLGGAIYLLPFFFVLEPGLVLQADPLTIVLTSLTAGVGLFIIGSSFEGYMIGIGRLWATRGGHYTLWSYLLRAAVIVTSLLIAIPGRVTDIVGVAASAGLLVTAFVWARRQRSEGMGPPGGLQ